MTYHADIELGGSPFGELTPDNLCFECGKTLKGGAVRYDGHAWEGMIKSIFMHPACAAVMGQRLICDGYPNRRQEKA